MDKEEKKCSGECGGWMHTHDDEQDLTPKYCDTCGGYYREKTEELREMIALMFRLEGINSHIRCGTCERSKCLTPEPNCEYPGQCYSATHAIYIKCKAQLFKESKS